ncbi:MAG: hypothetical protein V1644_00550 [Candidatus Micrarchaeota archaeon]
MANIIPLKYHPRLAKTRTSEGAFDVYHYLGGAKLTVRRVYADKVLPGIFGKKHWKRVRSLKMTDPQDKLLGKPRETIEYTHKNSRFVVRTPFVEFDTHYYRDFLRNYRRLYAARVRIESPVAWLEHSVTPTIKKPTHMLITSFKQGETLAEVLHRDGETPTTKKAFLNAFYELGKMHGAGVQHGHPHLNNIIVRKDGNVTLIDLKYIRGVDEPPIIEHALRPILPIGDLNTAQGALIDFAFLISSFANSSGKEIAADQWPKIAEMYKKGLEQGKRRVAKV